MPGNRQLPNTIQRPYQKDLQDSGKEQEEWKSLKRSFARRTPGLTTGSFKV